MASISNNNDRIVADNLLMVFDAAAHWDLEIPKVCKNWSELFYASKWNQLENLANDQKIHSSDWWQNKIETVKSVNSDRAPASMLIRDLNDLISEDVKPVCKQVFRRRFDPQITTTIVYKSMKEPVSGWLAGTLAVRQMEKLNQYYSFFAFRFLMQTHHRLAKPAEDHLLLREYDRNYKEIIPPIEEHQQKFTQIILRSAPQMGRLQRRSYDQAPDANRECVLSDEQRKTIRAEGLEILSTIQVSIPEFVRWRKSEYMHLNGIFLTNAIFSRIYHFAGNPDLAAVSRRFNGLVTIMDEPDSASSVESEESDEEIND